MAFAIWTSGGPKPTNKNWAVKNEGNSSILCTWIMVIDDSKIRPCHINGIPGREISNMTKTEAFSVTRSFTVTVEEMHNLSRTTREDIQHSQHFYTLLQTAPAREQGRKGENGRDKMRHRASINHSDNFLHYETILSDCFFSNVKTRAFPFHRFFFFFLN